MLTTTLQLIARIPHAFIVIALALALLYCGATRWRWPMLGDAALIALYAARPSLGTLMLVCSGALIRWYAPLATQAALLLGYPWHGLTAIGGRLLLPSVEQARRPERGAGLLPPPVMGKTTPLAPIEVHARPMAPAEWMRACNDDPTAPHLGIVGPSQFGKTTFALAIAGRRIGEVVITTTKNDQWSGAPVTRPTIKLESGDGSVDWTPIEEVIKNVHFEMLRRNAENDTQAAPLTLILDEFTTTLGNISKRTLQRILEIWSMGASCGVRTIVIAQEVNARAWGLEGRRDILGNLQFARVTPGRLWSLGRLDPNGGLTDAQPLDTGGLVTVAGEARLGGRGWTAPAAGGVAAGAPPTTAPAHTPQTNAHANDADTRIAQYMRWRAAGMTREIARALRQQTNDGLDDAEWAEAGKRNANGTS